MLPTPSLSLSLSFFLCLIVSLSLSLHLHSLYTVLSVNTLLLDFYPVSVCFAFLNVFLVCSPSKDRPTPTHAGDRCRRTCAHTRTNETVINSQTYTNTHAAEGCTPLGISVSALGVHFVLTMPQLWDRGQLMWESRCRGQSRATHCFIVTTYP